MGSTDLKRGPKLMLMLVAAAAAIAIGLLGCGGSSDSDTGSSSASGDSKEPIKIAYPAAQSGFMAFYDMPIGHGMEFAIEDINAKGGVEGRKLELVPGPDNKTDVNYVRDAALEALSKDPDFLVTSCDYDFGAPQARVANENGVLAFGCAGGTGYGLEGVGPLTFNTDAGNPTAAAILGEFTAKHFKKAYFVEDTSVAYSKELCELSEPAFTDNGGTIVGHDTMSNEDKSFAAQINRFRQDGGEAEALVLCSYPPGGANFLKQFRAAGFDTPVVGTAAFGGTFWFEQVPDRGEFYAPGVIGSMNGDDPDPRKNEIIKRYLEKYGEGPSSSQVFLGYASMEMLARAIERAGSTDSEAVREALESFKDEPLLVGETTYSDTCHIALGREEAVTKAVGDKAVYVEYVKPKEVSRERC
jgi:branched-chain amino acid transport system substrate-binding protein